MNSVPCKTGKVTIKSKFPIKPEDEEKIAEIVKARSSRYIEEAAMTGLFSRHIFISPGLEYIPPEAK